MNPLTGAEWRNLALAVPAVALLALVPLSGQSYYLALAVNIVMYAALCTAWTLFSGPTHYVSLATAAFFGLGAYTVGLGIDHVPYPVLVALAALVSGFVAALVGMATLRLSGIYFVVFTLGLAELIRQLVTWWQTNFTTGVGLYVFTDFTDVHLYWMLLALTVVIFLTGWAINRSRLGFAMRVIGNDETVAKHVGINTAGAKVVLFVVSGAFIGIVGAIIAPRYAYIEPPSAFNAMISFQVVIMALLGGTHRLWGPLIGVIPFTIVFDQVSARFPNHTSILIGLAFLAVVYLIPNGLVGRLQQLGAWLRNKRAIARNAERLA